MRREGKKVGGAHLRPCRRFNLRRAICIEGAHPGRPSPSTRVNLFPDRSSLAIITSLRMLSRTRTYTRLAGSIMNSTLLAVCTLRAWREHGAKRSDADPSIHPSYAWCMRRCYVVWFSELWPSHRWLHAPRTAANDRHMQRSELTSLAAAPSIKLARVSPFRVTDPSPSSARSLARTTRALQPFCTRRPAIYADVPPL